MTAEFRFPPVKVPKVGAHRCCGPCREGKPCAGGCGGTAARRPAARPQTLMSVDQARPSRVSGTRLRHPPSTGLTPDLSRVMPLMEARPINFTALLVERGLATPGGPFRRPGTRLYTPYLIQSRTSNVPRNATLWLPGGVQLLGDIIIQDHVFGFASNLSIGKLYRFEATQVDAGNYLLNRAYLLPLYPNLPFQAAEFCSKWCVDTFNYTGRWLDPAIPEMHYHQSLFDLDEICLAGQKDPKISLFGQISTAMLRWDTAAGDNPPVDPSDPTPPPEMDWTYQLPNPFPEDFGFNDNGDLAKPEMGFLAFPLGFNGNGQKIMGECRKTYRNAGTSKLFTCAMGNQGMFEIIMARIAIANDFSDSSFFWNNESKPTQSRCAMYTILHELGHALGLYERSTCKGKSFTVQGQTGVRYDNACMWFEDYPIATSWTSTQTNGLLALDDKLRIKRLYAREKPSSTPKAGQCSQCF